MHRVEAERVLVHSTYFFCRHYTIAFGDAELPAFEFVGDLLGDNPPCEDLRARVVFSFIDLVTDLKPAIIFAELPRLIARPFFSKWPDVAF